MSKNISKKTSKRTQSELKSLGLGQNRTEYPQTYTPQLLESFENKNYGKVAWTSFICNEFTTLCPKTGQPDFAKIYLNYIADKKMVESKSMKLYLFSFRNHGDFHEDCVQTICDDLVKLLLPKYLEVVGEFTPRGGISIFPFASYSCDEKFYKNLRDQRLVDYSPGKFSLMKGTSI